MDSDTYFAQALFYKLSQSHKYSLAPGFSVAGTGANILSKKPVGASEINKQRINHIMHIKCNYGYAHKTSMRACTFYMYIYREI